MNRDDRMRRRLGEALSPQTLEIVNESHLHAGHAGSPGTGESHYRVTIVSAAFAGKTRVERHRMVNAALAGELEQGLHALAIRADAPEELTR